MHKTSLELRFRVVVFALASVWGSAGGVCAQANLASTQAVWVTTAAGGVNLTRGNSKTLAFNGSVRSEAKSGANEMTIGAEANYGESEETQTDGVKTTRKNIDNDRAFVGYRRLLTERLFAALNGEVLQDDIAGIDYRGTVGPAVGYYFLKDTVNMFEVEAGPSYINQQLDDGNGNKTRDDRWALRVAERYDLKVSATAKLWEMAEYLPAFDDFGDYLLNAEAGAEAAMTTRVGMRLVCQYKHDSHPAEGKEKDDVALIAAVTVKL